MPQRSFTKANGNTALASIQHILSVPQKIDFNKYMRTVVGGNCKDVLALAICTSKLPLTLGSFNEQKTNDWWLANFHILFVDKVDSNNFGWSKAPYDNKKKIDRNLLKPLYTVDIDGEFENQTRFWSYKKCNNNMNKGERAPAVDAEQNTTFVLRNHTNLSFFLREEDYNDTKLIVKRVSENDDKETLPAYSFVILQLATTHMDNVKMGRGLKLRKIFEIPEAVSTACVHFLPETVELFDKCHQTSVHNTAIAKQIGRADQALVQYKPNTSAFVDIDNFNIKDGKKYFEICNQTYENGIDGPVYVSAECLLQCMHTKTVDRALRMLDIAFAHEAVTCFVVNKNYRQSNGFAQVHNFELDAGKLLFLTNMVGCLNGDVLPSVPNLCMNWQPSPTDNSIATLQWFNPEKTMEISLEDGSQVQHVILFELITERQTRVSDNDNSNFHWFMDDGTGMYYVLRAYHSKSISVQQDGQLVFDTTPNLYITWQLRPELSVHHYGNSTAEETRRRPKRKIDELDHLNLNVPVLVRQ